MWQLSHSITLEWFEDKEEYVLFVPESSETLLVNKIAFFILQSMTAHPSRLLNNSALTQILDHDDKTTILELEQQVQTLMEILQKKQMVKKISESF